MGFLIVVGFSSRLVLTVPPTPEHDKADNARVVLLPLLGSPIELGVAVLEATPVLLLALVLAQGLFPLGRLLKAAKEGALVFLHLQAVVVARLDKGL